MRKIAGDKALFVGYRAAFTEFSQAAFTDFQDDLTLYEIFPKR